MSLLEILATPSELPHKKFLQILTRATSETKVSVTKSGLISSTIKAALPKKKSSKTPWLVAGGALLLLCFLAVVGGGLSYYFWSQPASTLAAWQFVIDASSGLNETVEGQTKMDIAREALAKNLNILPASVETGLRVFGGDGSGQNGWQYTGLLVQPSTD